MSELKRRDTPENRAYWDHVERVAREVRATTGGSQAHEAEALLKGQPHEAGNSHDNVSAPNSRRSLAVGDSESLGQAVGGSDTARLQQMVECKHEDRTGGNDYMLCNVCGLMWDYRREQPHDMLVKLFAKQLDAQARAVREERDEAESRYERVSQLDQDMIRSLRADVERLTAERDDWRAMSATRNPPSAETVLRERAAEAEQKTQQVEQQVRALRASIEQLQRHRYMLRIDAGLRVEEMFVVWDEVKALVSAAIKEP